MFLFKKIAIIGTGLIGGSLGIAIKKNKLAKEVVGVSRHKRSIDLALKNKAVDRGALSFDIIKGSDLVILAVPVEAVISLKEQVRKIAGKDCLITDVGSTKVKISGNLSKIFPNYVGSHPLAGSEKRGILNATPGIFEGSLCVLTTTKTTQVRALAKIKTLWIRLGAKTVCMSPREHDKILSFTSHLAHIAAFTLINSIPVNFLRFASGGLRDTTRIASSDPELWQGIFLTNRAELLKALKVFELNLNKIESAIVGNNKGKLAGILRQARKKRNILE
ncbi:MAG: prephenate dehydrogenase/arogenate dehydrogenase family protein [Candidatus Omnitrophica bacterium]|nr:prephenate dehydrogenase/arogenate dehydrogenase family protein [Candidatus Omnitrophota bacterium]